MTEPLHEPVGTSQEAFDDGRDRKDLEQAAMHGGRSIFFARAGMELVTFTSAIVMARLLTPSEFGQAAVALFAIALSAAVLTSSVGAGVVQKQMLTHGETEAAASVGIAVGALAAATTGLLSPVALTPIFSDRIVYLVQLASPSFALAGLAAVSYGLLQRRLDFCRLGLIELTALTVGASVSIATAAAGLGAEALIVGQLSGTATAALLLLMSAPVRPGWPRREARGALPFGLKSLLSSFVGTAFRSSDYAILAARVNPATVGLYYRAYLVGVDYQAKLSQMIERVTFPIYSRARTTADIRELMLRTVRIQVAAIWPLIALLVVLAPNLIALMFGSRWHDAAVPTQILAIAGLATAVASAFGPVLGSAGRVGLLLLWNLGATVVYGAMIYLLAPKGLNTVCIGVSVYSMVMTVAMQHVVVRKVIGLPTRLLLSQVRAPFLSCLALLLAAYPTARALRSADLANPLVIALTSTAGLTLYLPALHRLGPSAFADVKAIGRRLAGRG